MSDRAPGTDGARVRVKEGRFKGDHCEFKAVGKKNGFGIFQVHNRRTEEPEDTHVAGSDVA